jgi:hypothetical protein
VFAVSRQLHAFDSKYVTQLKPDSARKDVGKAIKCHIPFSATAEGNVEL